MTLPKIDQNTLIPIGVVVGIMLGAASLIFAVATDRAEFKAELRAQAAAISDQGSKLQEQRDASRDIERRLRMVEEAKILTAESLKRIERALKIEQ